MVWPVQSCPVARRELYRGNREHSCCLDFFELSSIGLLYSFSKGAIQCLKELSRRVGQIPFPQLWQNLQSLRNLSLPCCVIFSMQADFSQIHPFANHNLIRCEDTFFSLFMSVLKYPEKMSEKPPASMNVFLSTSIVPVKSGMPSKGLTPFWKFCNEIFNGRTTESRQRI